MADIYPDFLMIRFGCPRCKTILENEAGATLSCPKCGQRLQAPSPAPRKPEAAGTETTAANETPSDLPTPVSTGTFAIQEVQVRNILGRDHVFWDCPLCQNQVDIPLDLTQQTVRCPHCSQRIDVPPVAVPLPTATSAPIPPPVEIVEPLAASPDYDLARPRRRRRDLDDDDYPLRIRRGSSQEIEACIRASASGLTCSLVGLGLSLVCACLWMVMVKTRPWNGNPLPLVLLILLGIAGSFVLSLLGVIFSTRGMNPINEENRGAAIGGLVCGIIGLVAASILGLLVSCVGLVLWPEARGW